MSFLINKNRASNFACRIFCYFDEEEKNRTVRGGSSSRKEKGYKLLKQQFICQRFCSFGLHFSIDQICMENP